jgi:hypothetical protein
MFPLLRELPAIGGEILAGGFLAIPLRGVEQYSAAFLLVLQQVESAAAPVRGDFSRRLAGILFQHNRMLQFAERSAHRAL